MPDLAILVLRLCLGVMFMAHGVQKAFGMFAGAGIQKFSGFLSSLGFSHALFWAYLAAYVELIGGLCVILGLFTRTAASCLLVLMAVAILKVHISKGFFLMTGGFEYAFIIAAICLALILSGPGKFGITKNL